MTTKRKVVLAYIFVPVSLALALLLLPEQRRELAWIGPLLGAGYVYGIVQARRSCGHGPLGLGPGRLFWPWPFDCPTCGAPPN